MTTFENDQHGASAGVYGRRPITEADIDDELRRGDGPTAPRA
jgi:hypothetical protein